MEELESSRLFSSIMEDNVDLSQVLCPSDWKNIQGPVKDTFEKISSAMTIQAQQIKQIQASFDDAVNKKIEELTQNISAESIQNKMKPAFQAIHDQITSEIKDTLQKALDDPAGQVAQARGTVAAASGELVRLAREAEAARGRARELEGEVARLGRRLGQLEAGLNEKANQQALDEGLRTKPSWPDLEGLLAEKADLQQLQRLYLEKADRGEVEAVAARAKAALTRAELRATLGGEVRTAAEAVLPALLRDPALAGEGPHRRPPTATCAGCANCMSGPNSQGRGWLQGLEKEEVMSMLRELARRREPELLEAQQEAVERAVAARAEATEARTREHSAAQLDRHAARCETAIETLRSQLEAAKRDLVQVINKKAYKSDVGKSLQVKADRSALEGKVDKLEYHEQISRCLQQLSALAADVAWVKGELRLDVEKLRDQVTAEAGQSRSVARLGARLAEAATKAEVLELVGGLRRDLDYQKQQLQQQASLNENGHPPVNFETELAPLRRDVEELHRTVSTQLMVGRWLWRSGRKGPRDNAIVWDVQALNTVPDAFRWTRDSPVVLATVPGLYRLTTGFFTLSECLVQVRVNEAPVLDYQPLPHRTSASPARSGGGGGTGDGGGGGGAVLRRHRHAVGNVTCAAVDQHLALPPNAAITVMFQSTSKVQGFLMLHKL